MKFDHAPASTGENVACLCLLLLGTRILHALGVEVGHVIKLIHVIFVFFGLMRSGRNSIINVRMLAASLERQLRIPPLP